MSEDFIDAFKYAGEDIPKGQFFIEPSPTQEEQDAAVQAWKILLAQGLEREEILARLLPRFPWLNDQMRKP